MNDTGVTPARFDAPAVDRPTRIAVLADLHLAMEGRGTWRVAHRTEERLERAVASMNRRPMDAVLFNGDLVQSGSRAEYEAFDDIVAALDVPFYATPGNYDLTQFGDGEKLTFPEFERRYAPGGLPFHERAAASI